MKAELVGTYRAALVVARWVLQLLILATVAAGIVLALGAFVACLGVLLVVALVWGSVWGLKVALRFVAGLLAPLEVSPSEA
jgi:hypothetical protein